MLLNGHIMPINDDDDEDYKIETRKDGYKRERDNKNTKDSKKEQNGERQRDKSRLTYC